MKIICYIFSLAVDVFIKAITRPRGVYSKLALASLIMFGGAISTPLWQQAVESVLYTSGIHNLDTPLPALVSAFIFLLLTIIFAILAQKYSTYKPESLVETKSISAPIIIGASNVYCYCGSILATSNIDVVVTSENCDLDLGSINGTSVSGRVRRLAATFNSDGTLNNDPVFDSISKWKSKQAHAGPYILGMCVTTPSFNAIHKGIRSIINGVALNKHDSGINHIDESANRKIIDYALNHCRNENLSSIFIPVFGLGSGGISKDEAVSKTLYPLVDILKQLSFSFNVYVGTYRISDAARVATQLLRMQ